VSLSHQIQAEAEAHDGNINDFLCEGHSSNTLKFNASRGGSLNGDDDLIHDALGALGLLAIIFGARLSITDFIAQRKKD